MYEVLASQYEEEKSIDDQLGEIIDGNGHSTQNKAQMFLLHTAQLFCLFLLSHRRHPGIPTSTQVPQVLVQIAQLCSTCIAKIAVTLLQLECLSKSGPAAHIS